MCIVPRHPGVEKGRSTCHDFLQVLKRKMPPFSPRLLFQQVAQELLRRIRSGDLHDLLPGEETLAGQIGVSRPVLRQALDELRRQGIVATAKGKRTRILQPGSARERGRGLPSPLKRRRLLVLGPFPPPAARHLETPVLDLLQSRLEKRGWLWEEHFGKALGSPRGARTLLQQLWEQSRADCALLIGSTAEMQAWAVREAIPALVLGSPAEGCPLPFVDVHYDALGWHAGGRFAAAGRRRITVFTHCPLRMGDRATLRGLRNFAATTARALEIVEVEVRPASLVSQLEGISRIAATHGWLFLFPADAITAYTHLLASGHRFPGEIAILSREAFPWIGAMTPSLAHYRANHHLLVQRSVAILDKLALGVTGLKGAAIMPQFVPGETLPIQGMSAP